ncbi:MAG: hypothetical protein IPM79_26080 [Polyangiaceae bacterium]|nr:hypothetical protein [Polyangiaceae bacterium]MBK8940987.1 hypothetical protein [Polyangiaceae bacterium]
MKRLNLVWVCGAALVACSEEVPVGGFEGGGGQGGGLEGGGPQGGGDGAEGGGGAGAGGGAQGASVRIHLRSTTETFDHQDGLSGQTPLEHASGVRSLTLYRQEGDPSPLVVFDLGQDSAEVDYADGADTIAFTAKTADLADGVFTLARVVHSWVRYRVAATMHNGVMVPGQFDNFQVLSDGTLYEGELYDAGAYTYVFGALGMEFPQSGADAPVPEWEAAGGFSVRFEDGEWAYYFPVNLAIDTDWGTDTDVYLDVNMHDSFRWQDQSTAGFTSGVFDVTPTTFEPVLRFGANSFSVSVSGS